MIHDRMEAPIPGENYTSDTRNYPWHRPPEQTDYVQIVDGAIKRIFTDAETSSATLAMLETGETVIDYVTGIIRLGVSKGQLPIDVGILAAGPIAKAVQTLADVAGIKYELGWEDGPRIMTSERLLMEQGIMPEDDTDEIPEPLPEEEMVGLMAPGTGPAPQDIQDEMLGYAEEEEL